MKNKNLITCLIFLFTGLNLFGQNYYYKTTEIRQPNLTTYFSFARLAYGTNNTSFRLGDYRGASQNSRFFYGVGGLCIEHLSISAFVPGEGVVTENTAYPTVGVLPITLGYDFLTIPNRPWRGTIPHFIPFSFSLSGFAEIKLSAWGVDKLSDDFSYGVNARKIKIGINLISSLLYADIAYNHLFVLNPEPDNMQPLEMNKPGYLSISTGLNLGSFSGDSRTAQKRVRVNLPSFEKSSLVSVRGEKGSFVSSTDNAHIDIILTNTSRTNAENISLSIRELSPDPNTKITPVRQRISLLRPNETYLATIRVENRNARVGENRFLLTLSGYEGNFKQEMPISYNVRRVDVDIPVASRDVIYNPTDIDYSIPLGRPMPNRKALIILNDNYSSRSIENINVGYNVKTKVKNYFIQSLGISEDNVIIRRNLTIYQMDELFDSQNGSLANMVGSNTELIIYILGHGMSSPVLNSNFILCADSDPSSPRNPGYSIDKLVLNLDHININNYLLIIDACYSGTGSETLAPRISSQNIYNPRTGLILTSSGDNEVAHIYEDKGHTLFSYYFLKAINDVGNRSRRDVTIHDVFGELSKETGGMRSHAFRVFNRTQTPQLIGQGSMVLMRVR